MYAYQITRIFFLGTLAFILAVLWTPVLTHFLYKYRLGKQIRKDPSTPIYSKLHQYKSGTPTMGGMLVWVTTLFLAIIFFAVTKIPKLDFISQFNFLSRSETLLPLGALVASAIVGLVDDYLNVKGIGPKGGGLRVLYRLVLYTIIAVVGAWWFFFKLDWDLIRVPFLDNFNIGWYYIPLFIFVIVSAAFSVNEADGLDGLAGGILMTCFAAFGAIAFAQGRYNLACFCGVITGSLLAFLWFNIYPARFFMGDTGAMSLGITLGIVAMLTNTVLLLPIIGFILVVESLSVIIQTISKKVWGKKVFLSTPYHHHLEALGWPEPKIVMRFWVISAVMVVLGLIIFLVDKTL